MQLLSGQLRGVIMAAPNYGVPAVVEQPAKAQWQLNEGEPANPIDPFHMSL